METISLQTAYSLLSDRQLCPVFVSTHKFIKSKLLSSPQGIQVYCPMNLLAYHIAKINEVLPEGFNIVYIPDEGMIHISPDDGRFQYICNVLFSCESIEQVQTAAAMVQRFYPHSVELNSLIKQKTK